MGDGFFSNLREAFLGIVVVTVVAMLVFGLGSTLFVRGGSTVPLKIALGCIPVVLFFVVPLWAAKAMTVVDQRNDQLLRKDRELYKAEGDLKREGRFIGIFLTQQGADEVLARLAQAHLVAVREEELLTRGVWSFDGPGNPVPAFQKELTKRSRARADTLSEFNAARDWAIDRRYSIQPLPDYLQPEDNQFMRSRL